jgi:hypothetical protein
MSVALKRYAHSSLDEWPRATPAYQRLRDLIRIGAAVLKFERK